MCYNADHEDTMDFLEHAITLDTYLVSEYPGLVKLGDHLYADIENIIKVSNTYRTKEALKLLLINLYIGYRSGLAVRYSRRKSHYSGRRRFSRIFFRYDRVIPIIDALIELDYVEQWLGHHFPEKDLGRETRMAAKPKLVQLFHDYVLEQAPIRRLPPEPEDLIQLRDKDGDPKAIRKKLPRYERWRENLARYNKFIEEQVIEFRLPPDVQVNYHFVHGLVPMISNGSITMTDLSTGEDLLFQVFDEQIPGFELGGRRYILEGNGSPRAKKHLIRDVGVHISNSNEYYKLYYITCLRPPDVGQQPDDSSIEKPLSDYGIQRLTFQSHYNYLHRVFNESMNYGGRFFGALYINMPKEVRRHIFINGSPTVELDYKANHIRILYHDEGIDYQDDPYLVLCDDPGDRTERSLYKIVFLVAINAKDEEIAIAGIRDKLRKDGYRGDYLTSEFIRRCLTRVKERHPEIARGLHTGVGLALQNVEGQVIDRILVQTMKAGVTCLPIHDSFIVPAEAEDLLYQLMMDEYRPLNNGYSPVIEKVE